MDPITTSTALATAGSNLVSRTMGFNRYRSPAIVTPPFAFCSSIAIRTTFLSWLATIDIGPVNGVAIPMSSVWGGAGAGAGAGAGDGVGAGAGAGAGLTQPLASTTAAITTANIMIANLLIFILS